MMTCELKKLILLMQANKSVIKHCMRLRDKNKIIKTKFEERARCTIFEE